MKCNRWLRSLVCLVPLLGFGLYLGLGSARAADYPDRPIRMIVPFGPGGSSDLVARLLTKHAQQYLGQPLVVENRPGAAAMIGLNELVQAQPDGYTIGITNSGMVVQPLYGIARHNYPVDLEALAEVGEIPFVLAVKADSPWQTIEQFMDYARAHPKAMNYGITGIGNTSHLGPAQLQLLAKFPMEAVNFDGGGTLINSLLGGHIQAAGINPVDIKEQVKAGRIRVLVVFGERRLADPMYKDAPTARERGYDVVVTLWQGIGAPRNLPAPVKAKLADAFAKLIALPETQEAIRQLGMEPIYRGPDEFARLWVDQQNYFKRVVTDTGILKMVKEQIK